MAKIRNSNPKTSSGGYDRVFDSVEVGTLIQKVQSTVISNGSELERIIVRYSVVIENLDKWVEDFIAHKIQMGTYLCPKKALKGSSYKMSKHEPDMAIFQFTEELSNCYIVEMKDGDSFDTKKADGEHKSREEYCTFLGRKIPFITNFYICCFNQSDKEIIQKGFKEKFSIEEIMTGQELCSLLGIDYEKITKERKEDAADNLEYFISEFIKIPAVKTKISNDRRAKVIEEGFYDEIEEYT